MTWLSAALLAVLLLQTPVEAIATFKAILKSADKKHVVVEVENGETMKLFVTHKTKFIRKGQPAQPKDFHDAESVTVDAERDVRMNLLAMRVEAK